LSRVPVSRLNINYKEIERRGLFERKKLRKMIDYAYTDQCLRWFILEYFGERMTGKGCSNCSNCLDEGESCAFTPLEKPAIKTPSSSKEVARKEKIIKKKLPEKLPEELDLPCHEDLFTSLKEMRLKLARISNLPPFVIFHDRTLRAICRQLPQTTSELLGIKGCGEYKVGAYGNQTLEVIRAYLEAHPDAKPLR